MSKLNYTVAQNEFEKLKAPNYLNTHPYPSSVQTTSDNWMQSFTDSRIKSGDYILSPKHAQYIIAVGP
jgi:hypothetical protein